MSEEKERPPYVKWERMAVEDREESLRAGSYKTKDVDMVIITPVGTRDRIPRLVVDWFKQIEQQAKDGRFPPQWVDMFRDSYERWKRGEATPPAGTPIKGWPVLSPAQQANVINADILTVEDLSRANDEARRRIGMGAQELVTKAVSWLKASTELGTVTQEITALKTTNAALEVQVKQQAATIAALAAELKALKVKEAA